MNQLVSGATVIIDADLNCCWKDTAVEAEQVDRTHFLPAKHYADIWLGLLLLE